MSVPVREAAEAIGPFLSAGGDAALRQLAKQAGKAVADAAARVVAQIRGSLKSDDPSLDEIEGALRAGLEDGSLDEAEVRILASLVMVGGDQINVKGNVTIGGSVFHRNIFNLRGKEPG